jgi:hypothetical protein
MRSAVPRVQGIIYLPTSTVCCFGLLAARHGHEVRHHLVMPTRPTSRWKFPLTLGSPEIAWSASSFDGDRSGLSSEIIFDPMHSSLPIGCWDWRLGGHSYFLSRLTGGRSATGRRVRKSTKKVVSANQETASPMSSAESGPVCDIGIRDLGAGVMNCSCTRRRATQRLHRISNWCCGLRPEDLVPSLGSARSQHPLGGTARSPVPILPGTIRVPPGSDISDVTSASAEMQETGNPSAAIVVSPLLELWESQRGPCRSAKIKKARGCPELQLVEP